MKILPVVMAAPYNSFDGTKGFCWNCGTILPMMDDMGFVKCFTCKSEYGPEVFGAMENHYEVDFRSSSEKKSGDVSTLAKSQLSNSSGPLIERKCAKCGHDTMTYATLQLRSADEGQTVFYTCVICGYKETENS